MKEDHPQRTLEALDNPIWFALTTEHRILARSHGLARDLLISIIDSEHSLVLSNEMLYELARVLRYPRLRAFYDLTEILVYDYIASCVVARRL